MPTAGLCRRRSVGAGQPGSRADLVGIIRAVSDCSLLALKEERSWTLPTGSVVIIPQSTVSTQIYLRTNLALEDHSDGPDLPRPTNVRPLPVIRQLLDSPERRDLCRSIQPVTLADQHVDALVGIIRRSA